MRVFGCLATLFYRDRVAKGIGGSAPGVGTIRTVHAGYSATTAALSLGHHRAPHKDCFCVAKTASGYSRDGPVSNGLSGLPRRFVSRKAAM